ncbi:unnamed protein product, partial [Durusdinium trenchii]
VKTEATMPAAEKKRKAEEKAKEHAKKREDEEEEEVKKKKKAADNKKEEREEKKKQAAHKKKDEEEQEKKKEAADKKKKDEEELQKKKKEAADKKKAAKEKELKKQNAEEKAMKKKQEEQELKRKQKEAAEEKKKKEEVEALKKRKAAEAEKKKEEEEAQKKKKEEKELKTKRKEAAEKKKKKDEEQKAKEEAMKKKEEEEEESSDESNTDTDEGSEEEEEDKGSAEENASSPSCSEEEEEEEVEEAEEASDEESGKGEEEEEEDEPSGSSDGEATEDEADEEDGEEMETAEEGSEEEEEEEEDAAEDEGSEEDVEEEDEAAGADKAEGKKGKKKKEKEAGTSLAETEEEKLNSVTANADWQSFGRWLRNKKSCPASIVAACKNPESRQRIFEDYCKTGRNKKDVTFRHERRLEESQRTKLKYGFRNSTWIIKQHGQERAEKKMERKKTVQNPELPDDPTELLFFVLVELNVENIAELKRITSLEMEGTPDSDQLKQFVEAGGVLNGDQHLQVGNLVSAEGKQKLTAAMASVNPGKKPRPRKGGETKGDEKDPKEVVPKTPLERAATLQNQVLSKANQCRDQAFKLRPLKVSGELIDQLRAMDSKLQDLAGSLQELIRKKKNKNKYYVELVKEVEEASALASERVELARELQLDERDFDRTVPIFWHTDGACAYLKLAAGIGWVKARLAR